MNEYRVSTLSELAQNVPTEVEAGDRKVVLVRQGHTVHALAATCPHRGVPMAKGTVVGDRIVCGVHRAAFALDSGELLSPPACENLARYEVRIEADVVHVTIDESVPEHPVPFMSARGDDPRHMVVVGGGAAGWRAAEGLRREGFTGRVTVVGEEAMPPYDRTELSKGFLSADGSSEPRWLRDVALSEAKGVERIEARAVSLDTEARQLRLEGVTEPLEYDALIVATGCEARKLDVPGETLAGVHVLRSLQDAEALNADLVDARRVVVVGAGFIGLEAASGLSDIDGLHVSVVTPDEAPMGALFGDAFAQRLAREHREAGVELVTGAKVVAMHGEQRVTSVSLDDGRTLEADLVLVAVGAKPRTDWLPFPIDDDGGVTVDGQLRVPGAGEVYLAGDIARLPTPWGTVRIEHWRFAQETGELAARNALGAAAGYQGTPFFWSMQQIGGSYTLTGHQSPDDDTVGSVDEQDFALAYRAGGRITAVLAHGIDDDITALAVRMGGVGPLPESEVSGAPD